PTATSAPTYDTRRRLLPPPNPGPDRSDVVVQLKLVRMRAKADGVDLGLALLRDPGDGELDGEHAAGLQEVLVGFERVARRVERPRNLRHLGELLRRQVVEILVDRRRRFDAIDDAVETGHQHRGERQVRVAGRVGTAE